MNIVNKNELYFDDTDYDAFEYNKQNLNTKVIRDSRKVVQDKLLDLNTEVLKELSRLKIELYNHANPKNTTSLIFPCWYNHGKVDWLGIRYGKSPKDIQELNKTMEPSKDRINDIKMNFQKHAYIQINIGYSGMDIGIFHAVPNGAVDRWYLHDHINNNDIKMKDKILTELHKLKGYGYIWHIYDTNIEMQNEQNHKNTNPEHVFNFDIDDIDTFLDWYSKYDKDGCYSSMLIHFPRYSNDISNVNILNTCITIIKQVYPVYKSMIWDIHLK